MRAEIRHHDNNTLSTRSSRTASTARCRSRRGQLEACPASAPAPGARPAENGWARRGRVYARADTGLPAKGGVAGAAAACTHCAVVVALGWVSMMFEGWGKRKGEVRLWLLCRLELLLAQRRR